MTIDACSNVTCTIDDEKCVIEGLSGICKCGSANSCNGTETPICDSLNSLCVKSKHFYTLFVVKKLSYDKL